MDEALQIFLDMQKTAGIEPNVRVWTTLIAVYGKNNQLEKAFNALNLMERASIEPTAQTWRVLVVSCLNRGDPSNIRRLLQKINQHKVKFEDTPWALMLYACAQLVDLKLGTQFKLINCQRHLFAPRIKENWAGISFGSVYCFKQHVC